MTDLHDTTNCPVGAHCERCGARLADLKAFTIDTPLGVLCVTLCTVCANASDPPRMKATTVAKLTGEHAEHLRGEP